MNRAWANYSNLAKTVIPFELPSTALSQRHRDRCPMNSNSSEVSFCTPIPQQFFEVEGTATNHQHFLK